MIDPFLEAQGRAAPATTAETFWRDLAARAPALPLPEVPAWQRAASPSRQRLERSVPAASLVAAAARSGLDVGSLIQTAWAATLARDAQVNEIPLRVVRAKTGATVWPVVVTLDFARPLAAAAEATALALSESLRHAAAPPPALAFEAGFVELAPGAPWPDAAQTPGAAVCLLARPGPTAVELVLVWSAPQLDAAFARGLFERLERVLSAVSEGSPSALGALPLLSRDERAQVLGEWNGPRVDRPKATVPEAILAQVAKTPDALAVVAGAQRLDYRALEQRSAQVARWLVKQGVGPEHRVAVVMDPGVETIVALLGVLRAGGAYVPLDPELPDERLGWCVNDVAATAAIAHGKHAARLNGRPVLTLDSSFASVDGLEGALPPPPSPAGLAYVIYTSGSTGEPKGVAVAHASLVNHHQAIADRLALGPNDRVLQFTPVCFDAAGEEIYPVLARGGVVAVTGNLVPPHELAAMIDREQLTVLSLPPAFLHDWVAEMARRGQRVPKGLRAVLLGGEKINPEALGTWRKVGGEHVPWFNVYGPTEATVTSALCEISPGVPFFENAVLPIGTPIANGRISVLDERLEPLPPRHPGELFIAGAGLARGYWNRPAETADKFRPDPHGPPGERMYRSGDVARHLDDGRLEFLGRVDHQIKIRGKRLEPGEVEAKLRAQPGVAEAVVTARDDGPGGRWLVAYVVPTPGATPEPAALKSALAQSLPEHLVPGVVVRLPAFPMTPNGKIDRKALPKPVVEAAAPSAGGAALTKTEQTLADIWKEVLGLAQVKKSDDFFELGGQSLSAMQTASRVQELLGVNVELQVLFEETTLEKLAAAIDRQLGPDVGAMSDAQVAAMLESMARK